MCKQFLRDIGEDVSLCPTLDANAVLGVSRVILYDTLEVSLNVTGIDVAGASVVYLGGDFDITAVGQKSVAVIGLNFGDHILVILKTLYNDMTNLAALSPINRRELSSKGFLVSMTGDIINTFFLVELSLNPIAVSDVVNEELNMVVHILSAVPDVREQLENVDAVAIYMGVVNERVEVFAVRAFPSEDYFIVIALVAVDKARVGVDDGGVGDAQGVVAVIGVDHVRGAVYISAGVAVDDSKTCRRNGYGHSVRTVRICFVAHLKVAGVIIPSVNEVSAALVGVYLDLDTVLGRVGKTGVYGIYPMKVGKCGSS